MLKVDLPLRTPSVWTRIKELRRNELSLLAPKMQQRITAMLEEAQKYDTLIYNAGNTRRIVAFDPIVFETWRPDELQKIYFKQGTTKAASAIYGWHFYGLAVDCISETREWTVPDVWWTKLAEIAEAVGLKSGHRWENPDDPHVYFGTLKKSPSDIARQLYFGTKHWQSLPIPNPDSYLHKQGLRRVWEEVGAL